jgi:aspartyl-tRNA(Asn)/glutamyl-tRNA(Gln) amidotransferase subunit A
MKSTYGRTGTGPGMMSFSETSTRGPIVRSVRDAARYLDVIAGPTLTDPLSLPRPAVSYEEQLVRGDAVESLRGLRVAWSSTLGYASTDHAVAAIAHEAAEALISAAGLELVDVSIEFSKPGTSWTVFGTLNEAAHAYEDMRDRVQDLTDVLQMTVASFEHLRPDVLLKAMRGRWSTVSASAALFAEVDLLLTPTTPTTAFEAEGRLAGFVNETEVSLMGLSAPFTAPFNLTGQPACSIPAGLIDGMPVGLQVVARRHEDLHCLAAAAVLEDARPWPKLAPLDS